MIFKKRIFNNAALAVIQTITSAFLLFFLYRYLLNKLGPEQLGIWAVVLASTSVGRLSDMGFSGAALKFVAKCLAYGDQKKAAEVVQTASLSIGFALAVLAVATYPLLQLALTWSMPKNSLPTALSILPWAVLSLWFGMVAGIFQSALDGCQRMDIRNLLLILCNVIYLGIALLLVPAYGLEGLAKGQLVQAVVLLLLSWFMLRRFLPELPLIPWRWSKKEFKEMFSYAINFQIGSLAGLLFDPVTKFFLAKYGGLANTAYYEMANQVIAKARGVLVSALQAVIPVIAGTKDDEHEVRLNVYRKSYSLFFFLTWPYYIALTLAFPLLSLIWIGHFENVFILYGTLLTMGWLLSNLGVPAYFFNIGTGFLLWNTVLHVMTGLLNLSLAYVLGQQYGAVGVVVAAMISLILPNWLLVFVVKKRLGIPATDIVPTDHRVFVLLILMSGIGAMILFMETKLLATNFVSSLSALLFFLSLCMVALWFHPYQHLIQHKIKSFLLGNLKKLSK
jgi:O-antigen/teichoic acid export membrane protein